MHLKTAGNRKKIFMTRGEWEAIGKKAGWEKPRSRKVKVYEQTSELKIQIDYVPHESEWPEENFIPKTEILQGHITELLHNVDPGFEVQVEYSQGDDIQVVENEGGALLLGHVTVVVFKETNVSEIKDLVQLALDTL